jgi:lipid-A-disaccharide synthase
LKTQVAGLQPVLLVAPNLDKEKLAARLNGLDFSLPMIQAEPFEMIGMTDAILCASGTATLMVGLMEKPMVIMYRMNPVSAFIARRVVKSKYFGLVNLVMEREVAPERFQNQANPRHLADLLLPYLANLDVREKKSLELKTLKTLLGNRGAIERVAVELEKFLVRPNA